MRKSIHILVAFLVFPIVVLALSGCSKKDSVEKALPGHWVDLHATKELEFIKGGPVIASGNSPVSGQWLVNDEGELIVTFTTLGTTLAEHGQINKGVLEIFEPGGNLQSFYKISATGEIVSEGVESKVIALSEANTKDIWSTSVYSYAPGGGGPGGGKEDDRLRVGGYGDEYVALIQFPVEVASDRQPKAVWLQMHTLRDDGKPAPIVIQPILSEWNWKRGDRLWWKDLPAADSSQSLSFQAPEPNSLVRLDVTSLFQAWKNGKQNFGLMIRPLRNQNDYTTFYSTRASDVEMRPKLTIIY